VAAAVPLAERMGKHPVEAADVRDFEVPRINALTGNEDPALAVRARTARGVRSGRVIRRGSRVDRPATGLSGAARSRQAWPDRDSA
jgi:hypothetical protein